MAAHVTQDRIVAGLHRHVQVRAHLRLVSQRPQQRVLDVDHLDARQPHPLHARHPRDFATSVAKLESALGIAVVTDADPGHHHLRLAVGDAARYPSSRIAVTGRERASPRTVGMMQ